MRPGSQVQAGDRSLLDTLKAMAQKYGLVYETVSDQGGKAQYLFVHPGLQIFVSIPADIENDHEAAIALEAGYNSALGTAVYPVSSPAP